MYGRDDAPVMVRLLHEGDQALLERSEPDVFDNRVDPALAAATLRDPRHHVVAAIKGDRVVGFASAVDYLHPDKPRALDKRGIRGRTVARSGHR